MRSSPCAHAPLRACGLVLAAALLLGPAVARSTSEVPITQDELLERSDWAGSGTVVSSRSEWRERQLWTFVELSVSETLKGGERGSVTVVVPGGFDFERGISMQTPGVPAMFPVGARMLIFGRRSELDPSGLAPVSLMSGMRLLSPQSPTGALDRIRSAAPRGTR